MESEIVICPKCRQEKEFLYSGFEVVSETKCHCIRKPLRNKEGLKILDAAIKLIDLKLKTGEIKL